MEPRNCRRRLIVNADDFGNSSAINQAVIRAHRQGVLTTASLMVNGDAVSEAVHLARQHPTLGVGLHLTLVCGRAALTQKEIPGLVSANGAFSSNPVVTGMKYFFQRQLVSQLDQEIAAQVKKFSETGLVMDHLNGHLNLHLHPIVFRILMRRASQWGIRRLRFTRDPLWTNVAIARGNWPYRLSHALVFGCLTAWARPQLEQQQIRYVPRVYGLLQTSQVREDYVLKLLDRLPEGDSELYSHPCLEKFKDEFEALISPKVRGLITDRHIELIRYQDL